MTKLAYAPSEEELTNIFENEIKQSLEEKLKSAILDYNIKEVYEVCNELNSISDKKIDLRKYTHKLTAAKKRKLQILYREKKWDEIEEFVKTNNYEKKTKISYLQVIRIEKRKEEKKKAENFYQLMLRSQRKKPSYQTVQKLIKCNKENKLGHDVNKDMQKIYLAHIDKFISRPGSLEGLIELDTMNCELRLKRDISNDIARFSIKKYETELDINEDELYSKAIERWDRRSATAISNIYNLQRDVNTDILCISKKHNLHLRKNIGKLSYVELVEYASKNTPFKNPQEHVMNLIESHAEKLFKNMKYEELENVSRMYGLDYDIENVSITLLEEIQSI